MKLWASYLSQELFKSFFFFLLCIFLLYSLIEYATQINSFLKNSLFTPRDIFMYYVHQFLKRAEFVVPLAFLLGVIHVLTSLNTRNEWTVLQLTGLSSYRLLTPFFTFAFICSLFLWANFEYLLPSALKQIDAFQHKTPQNFTLSSDEKKLHTLPLQGGSKLIYRTYLPERRQFYDVVWIKGIDELWKIKYLNEDPLNPVAHYADHLVRNAQGNLEKKESYSLTLLPGLTWNSIHIHDGFTPPDYQSFSGLIHLMKTVHLTSFEKGKVMTAFLFKLFVPLLSPLALIGVAPYCLTFARYRSLFSIYALALFALFAFYMLLDALAIMSDHSLLSPYLAMISPFALASVFTMYHLRKHLR
ncbi:MAG: LptF/LptG family permease [Candidatus Rhabdochlamydia sp.]